jgi:methylmalonyl-CoA/ethylmalonyl-CoA epimerase
VAEDAAAVAAQVRTLDHVAIAVHDMGPAAHLFVDVLGATLLAGGDNELTGNRLMQLSCRGFKIELMQPLDGESVLTKHLDRRGEGFHHMTFLVDDVPLTVDGLSSAGLSSVGTDLTHADWKETFISPKSTFGTLIQFVSTPLRFDIATTAYDVADVLAGRVVWRDYVACLR